MKDTNPKSIQKLLDFLKDKKEFKILSSLLLRNMQKAVYRPENLGHYGLASKCYTHFTSPIRRYPDTTVHRLLRTYLFNGDMSSETIRHWQEKLVFIGENSSARAHGDPVALGLHHPPLHIHHSHQHRPWLW